MKRITAGLSVAALLAAAPVASAATPKNTAQPPSCTGGSGGVTITSSDKDISSYWFNGDRRGTAVEVPLYQTSITDTATFDTITVKLGVSSYTFDATCTRL